MLYTTLTIGNKDYKLRLPAKEAAAVERKIGGRSLLAIFGTGSIEDLPNIDTIVAVLHGSMQVYEHGITLDDAYGIFDEYLESGGSYAGMVKEIVEVLKVSGFFRGAPEGAGRKKRTPGETN